MLKQILKSMSILAIAANAAVLSAQAQTPSHQASNECAQTSTSSNVERSPLFANLLERQVPVQEVIRVEVNPDDLSAPAAPGDRRFRVGAVKAANVKIDFAGLSTRRLTEKALPHAHGAVRSNGAGGFEWSGVVRSEQATALRLHFTGFYLPRNAELYLSNDAGDVAGPYTGRGPNRDGAFWAHTLWGSEITLHLFYDGTDTDRVLGATRFAIAHIGHLGGATQSVFSSPTPVDLASNLCSYNDDCILSPAGQNIPGAVQGAEDAVALILFASGRWLYICSGGLIEDTDAGSNIPLFLTANHCISRGREANSLEAYFHYTSGCSIPGVADVLGSSILATNRTGDYTLLRLSEQPPSSTVAPLTYNTSSVAFINDTPLYRISHPAGASQAYSEHAVDTSRATCSSWPRGSWIYSSDTLGGTEGGSSGSPVLNGAGEIVGQLSGACGYNVSDSCDSVSNATVDGALASYYPEVAPYLDPNTSCTDSDDDGFCAESADCNDSDPAVNPNADEDCYDIIDNDCDGLADDDDPNCQTGSCDTAAKGDSCTVDSDCCSNKCKGKADTKVCR